MGTSQHYALGLSITVRRGLPLRLRLFESGRRPQRRGKKDRNRDVKVSLGEKIQNLSKGERGKSLIRGTVRQALLGS